jgi:hypothetical protein
MRAPVHQPARGRWFVIASVVLFGIASVQGARAQTVPLSPPPAYAYPPPGYYYPYQHPPPTLPPLPTPGTHTHDGLYLRFNLGLGFTRVAATSGGYAAEYSGTGFHGDFALGGAVVENFILFGALNALTQSLPGGGTLQVSGLGAGGAYYLGVLNAFVSFTVARAVLSVLDGGGRTTTFSRAGVTFEAKFAKEWWVSPNWGLGVGGAGVFGRIGVLGDPNATWSVAGGALLFSATFN